jgi:hypothetical protein
MSLSVGKTNLLLRNLLRTPILELEASKLNLGEHTSRHCLPGRQRTLHACRQAR